MRNFLKVIISFCLIIFLQTPSIAGETKKLPLWQVGGGLGALSMPHYVGSDQRYDLPLVFPAFIYRGDYLRVTRKEARGLLFSSENVLVDLGFSGAFPVYSTGNDARKDMPDIPLTGEIGPRLAVRLYGNGDGNGVDVLARLPWRVVEGVDGTTNGWALGPDILIANIQNLPWGFRAFASLGLKYGSVKYNNLFYGVEDRYSTPSRPTYRAGQGVSWYSFVFSAGRKLNSKFSARFYLIWRTLHGSEVADSPLVRDPNYVSVGFWFTWLPWESKTMESDIDRLPEPEEDI